MSTRSRSKSIEQQPRPKDIRHRERSRSRSRNRSHSPRRTVSRDKSRRDEERDRPRDRPSRSRDRGRHHRKSRSRSHSRQRRRHDIRSHSHSPARSRSKDRKEKRKRRHSRSPSLSSSNDSDNDRKRRRKEKSSRRKESRERKKERRREKKEKKEKKKKGSSSSHWGKYGIITEVDLFTKGPEFHSWLVEERKINPETLTKDQEKKQFAHFIEDFNTATLPHEKFYDMRKYEIRMDALRQGEFLPPAEDTYDPEADMRALTGAHKRKAAEKESYMSREQLEELRRVQNERTQVGKMKLLGMDIKQTMGVRMDGTAFDDI